jgi:hypothetical protein
VIHSVAAKHAQKNKKHRLAFLCARFTPRELGDSFIQLKKWMIFSIEQA